MDPRVRHAIRLMSKDLRRPLDIQRAASAVHLSPSRLRHLFRQQTGIPPARYLKRLRLERARKLLKETFLPINQIMRQVGVSDESHFIRDFKGLFGDPPIRYRLLKAEKSQDE